MYIEKCMNNGIEYLRLVKSSRITNDKGIKTVRKKVIFNIGPLHKFDDGKPEYVERLKTSFKHGHPIIDSLNAYVELNERKFQEYKFYINEGSEECIGHPKIYSNALLERILEELEIIPFLNRYKNLTKYEFDIVGFFRLLVYGRILNPASKIGTLSQNEDYLDPIIKNDFNSFNVYDTLNFIYKYKKQLLTRINKTLVKKFDRKTNLVYYDVTNFYFEIENPDDDLENSDGTVTKGFKKLGVCKEERKLPIVQMGLFMDDKGLPISIEIFPGNTLDHQTVAPALKKSIDNLDMPRFIFVGDRGICEGSSLIHLQNQGHGWVVSKSISKSSKEIKDWIFNEEGYIFENSNFKYKSQIKTRTVKNSENVIIGKLTEKIVVYWSKSYYEKQKYENKSFYDFISKLKESPGHFKMTAGYNKIIKKFLKNDVVNVKTGEVINSKDLISNIDEEKIKAFEKELGYYQVVSSELEKSELEIIDTYHGLSRIEDQFRVMKGTLETRPLFVTTPEHIEAHLTICMISLLLIRIIQNKIVDFNTKNPTHDKTITKKKVKRDKYWEFGLSGDRLQNALNKWTIELLSGEYYRFNNLNNPDLKLILDAFNINIESKLYTKQDLKTLKTSIEIIQ